MAVPQVIVVSNSGIIAYLDKKPAPPRQGKLLALLMMKCATNERVQKDDLKESLKSSSHLIVPGNHGINAPWLRFVHYFNQYEWRRHVAPSEDNII